MEKTKLVAAVGSIIRLDRNTTPAAMQEFLFSRLRRENPEYQRMAQMTRRSPRFRYGIKLPPKFIESYFKDDNYIYLPRGVSNLLNDAANKFGVEIDFADLRISYQSNVLKLNFQPYPYQSKTISEAFWASEGVIVAPCGGGKTAIGNAIIAMYGQPSIILVHTTELLNQWDKELRTKLIIDHNDIGIYGGGRKHPARITVATIQTLYRMPEIREFLSKFGLLILDECHHVPADTFLGIINLSPARYRFGLTATPFRKDGKEFLIFDTFGPIVSQITDADLMKAGRSQSVKVNVIKTEYQSFFAVDDWARLINDLTTNVERNNQIINAVIESWRKGHFPLVLSDRVAHCKFIANQLTNIGRMTCGLLLGEMTKRDRNEIVELSRSGKIDCIVGTTVADEGLDIPQLSCLHLATPTSNEARVQQRTGRIRRPIEGKQCELFDYVDEKHGGLKSMWYKRRSLYKGWGFEI